MKDLIIYDFDGVLFDSRKAVCLYYDAVISHFGFGHIDMDDPVMMKKLMAYSNEKLFATLTDDAQLIKQMVDFVPHLTDKDMLEVMVLEDGASETIAKLSKQYPLAICTNRNSDIDFYLEHYNLKEHFSMIVNRADVTSPKPSPEGLIKLMDAFKSKNPLYVGDSEVDYHAAKGAKIDFISFKSSLFESHKIDNHLEIFDYLSKSI